MAVESIQSFGIGATVWRLRWSSIVAGVAAVGVSLWLFWDGLSRMWGWWLDAPEYSHGLLIPPVAAFLVWQQRDRLELVDFRGCDANFDPACLRPRLLCV